MSDAMKYPATIKTPLTRLQYLHRLNQKLIDEWNARVGSITPMYKADWHARLTTLCTEINAERRAYIPNLDLSKYALGEKTPLDTAKATGRAEAKWDADVLKSPILIIGTGEKV